VELSEIKKVHIDQEEDHSFLILLGFAPPLVDNTCHTVLKRIEVVIMDVIADSGYLEEPSQAKKVWSSPLFPDASHPYYIWLSYSIYGHKKSLYLLPFKNIFLKMLTNFFPKRKLLVS
jgi:hypothetical protein